MDRTVFLLANLCNYAIPATSILDIRLYRVLIKLLLLPVLKENSDFGRLLHKVQTSISLGFLSKNEIQISDLTCQSQESLRRNTVTGNYCHRHCLKNANRCI